MVAIGKRSLYRPIWDAFIQGKYKLIVSDDVIYEYEEILQQHASPGVANIVMEIFIESINVISQQIYYSWNAIEKDPDDNKFFDIAVAANVDYLVTNNTHFKALKNLIFPKVTVVSAVEF